MCATYTLVLKDDDELVVKLREKYPDRAAGEFRDAVLYPKQEAPVLGHGGKVALLRWGFPMEGRRSVLFNARAESLARLSLYRDCLRNRCLVPFTSFFEWGAGAQGAKTRYAVTPPEGERLYLAALWKAFPDGAGGRVFCFVIITTGPNGELARIHSRMPAVLSRDGAGQWLDPANDPDGLLRPYGGVLSVAPAGPR